MSNIRFFSGLTDKEKNKKANDWLNFLTKNKFDFAQIEKIDMQSDCPVIYDKNANKFSIDFSNTKNYSKKKGGIKSELISKAMGAGRYGKRILDLSAGLAIDSVFLAQLGYTVTAVERNPLIFLCLENAAKLQPNLDVKFIFGGASEVLKALSAEVDVIYFDPMFPEKTKSALPKQEMVFFKNLVGDDSDAADVLEAALNLKNIKRVVVKRPLKAEALIKTAAHIKGKLIRFDLYGRGN